MLRNRTILAVSLPLSVISSALTQESPQMQLSDLLLQVNSMSAEVQQLIVESDGAVLEESSIQMHLLRPDGFFWETLDPFYELVVTDGTLLWNYQPDLEQVVIEDWSSNKSELAADLLSGRTERLSAEYEVIRDESDSAEITVFKLLPLDEGSLYRQIDISFNEGSLLTIYIDNKNGQKTLWQFNKTRVNHQLAPELFRFQIPQGIDVIDNRAIPE
ncbi:MAG: outer membrane lipoprotein carrier protein LolA [Gammaproteobacteria bacterium]|nr:outer membrane lipoprotein carrier protein LolA [Gammaproteobacteria bacterium]|tara:strand:- start:28 stop:675 length:648 start_codon:yes stop_codon:yes gene_type:complete